MPRSHMLAAVLQSVALSALAAIISHHLLSNAFETAGQTELWLNITSTLDRLNNITQTRGSNTTSVNSTLIDGPVFNATISNTAGILNTTTSTVSDGQSESFYRSTFPQELLLLVLVAPLYYYWHIWLERLLPARPRLRTVNSLQEKTELEDSTHEEEVIQKWIAQGKVRRASLSWCNTALKWLLHVTIGTMWVESLRFVIEESIKMSSPIQTVKALYGWEIPLRVIAQSFGTAPLASLVGFILVPAHQRMTFESGIDLLFNSFIGIFAYTVLPRLAAHSSIQWAVGLWLENMENSTRDGAQFPQQYPRLGDEL